jgi:hypothetical protein
LSHHWQVVIVALMIFVGNLIRVGHGGSHGGGVIVGKVIH